MLPQVELVWSTLAARPVKFGGRTSAGLLVGIGEFYMKESMSTACFLLEVFKSVLKISIDLYLSYIF